MGNTSEGGTVKRRPTFPCQFLPREPDCRIHLWVQKRLDRARSPAYRARPSSDAASRSAFLTVSYRPATDVSGARSNDRDACANE